MQLLIRVTYKKTGLLVDLVKRGKWVRLRSVLTTFEYAEPVEYSNRTVDGGFVEGAHMMELSVELLKLQLPAYLKDLVK